MPGPEWLSLSGKTNLAIYRCWSNFSGSATYTETSRKYISTNIFMKLETQLLEYPTLLPYQGSFIFNSLNQVWHIKQVWWGKWLVSLLVKLITLIILTTFQWTTFLWPRSAGVWLFYSQICLYGNFSQGFPPSYNLFCTDIPGAEKVRNGKFLKHFSKIWRRHPSTTMSPWQNRRCLCSLEETEMVDGSKEIGDCFLDIDSKKISFFDRGFKSFLWAHSGILMVFCLFLACLGWERNSHTHYNQPDRGHTYHVNTTLRRH